MSRYELQSRGLGARLRGAFYATVDELTLFPEKNPIKIADVIRTRIMRPFPYLIFYAVESHPVFVLTVQYAGRDPAHLRTVVGERRES
jgi:hypothetical protein